MSRRRASLDLDQIPDSAEAFAEWVGPHLTVMARLAARLTSDSDRDDVVQEALLRAWEKRFQYDSMRGSLRTWLLAITADQARRSRRRTRPAGVVADLTMPGRSLDERLDVEGAVSRLPPRQRLAVNCFYFVDLSITETAALMRCSPGTVKSTLADARHRLKELLDG
jgi:RNA polymerase sigma-70 factor (ECF subfamily)